MRIRLTYRVEACIEGESIDEIRRKWHQQMPVPEDNDGISFDFVEMNSIEDGDTFKDMTDAWLGWDNEPFDPSKI